jgi:branched-chain amino acid aminotransferase
MKIWLNHQIADEETFQLDKDGWPEGNGIFETLRTESGEVFELARHMRRALEATQSVGIKLPNEELIRSAIAAVLKEETHGVGRLRLMFGPDHFLVIHRRYEDVRKAQVICTQATDSKVDGLVLKKYPYTDRLALLKSAVENGFDEVLCINSLNQLTEGAVSNFLFFINGSWVTTPLTAGVLPGVIRAIAIERCGVKVRNIEVNKIENIESALVISSLKIALPVSSIDQRALKVGATTQTLEDEIRSKTQKHSVG